MRRPLRWGITMPHAFQTLLLAALAVQAVRLAWLVIVWPSPTGVAPDTSAMHEATAATTSAFNPFFPDANAPLAASDTSGLVLHGIRNGPTGSSAILGNAQGQQGSYRSGETVAPGVTVVDIAADHVLLDANGTRSRLEFQAATLPTAAAPVAALPSAAPPAAANTAA